MELMRRASQAGQARDRAIEALLEQVDMPLPESMVEHEVGHQRESLAEEVDRAGLTMDAFLEGRGITQADLEKEISDDVRRSVKARFILDQLAEQEKLEVEQEEIGQYLTQMAYQQGVSPDALARQLTSSGQLGAVVGDVLRSKAARMLAERAQVTDEAGRNVIIGEQDKEADPDEESADETPAGETADAPAAKGRVGRRKSKAAAKE